MVDISKLDEKLNALTGLDFEAVEAQERSAGNPLLEITLSKSFQARLAAQALNCPVADIKELPLRKYAYVCRQVSNFLGAAYLEADDLSTPSEASPST